MKRFVVMKEVLIPDPENGPEFDTPAYQIVKDFDTKVEADEFVNAQAYPGSYALGDREGNDEFFDNEDDFIERQTFGEQDCD